VAVSRSFRTVVFSHGKESGPWGAKILALAAIARELEIGVESVDYQGIDDPRVRVDKLLKVGAGLPGPLVLVGSSLGGHVAAAAAARLGARALFLLAPAFYMPGYEEHTPRDVRCRAALIHGWGDAIVPPANSIRWASEQRAELHILDSDHRLQDRIGEIGAIFRNFLEDLR
jgi:pimeloyl-ACP methyl ester carboxylesterase